MAKNFCAATFLVCYFSAAASFAADLPSYKAPPPPPPPMMTWTGFYVGLNAGGTWGQSSSANLSSFALFNDPLWFQGNAFASSAWGAVPTSNASGFIGGGQIGYNWQFGGSFLTGVEADIQGIAASSGRSNVTGVAFNALTGAMAMTTTDVSKRLDYLGTVRGRLGYLVTPTLLAYGTGGLAYGGVGLNASQFSFDTGAFFGAGIGNTTFSNTLVGWTAGGGVEWMFMPGWSAKGEYLYYDLGSTTNNLAPVAGLANVFNLPPGSIGYAYASNVSSRYNGHIVRAGVNYHFNWGSSALPGF
ncbi:outer membrane beta-barrel protein [Methylocystis sp. WRRC1]|uniref:outer membrane protein n=1 Tax=Methylocystis sp. WRRC1 TaxID=1732014 RepID=UPI001D13D8C6|nr:outer membrane beta-barrel protein [Methylocystis sp. WRRC1]MCC3246400.1 outer membrane beta-barrel protein [Methylocystis sp. WRRC1]